LPDDRGTILNDLGAALAILGEREAGTARLEQAVETFSAAQTEWTRDRVPLDWARTPGNERMALLTLAGRSGDPARARRALEQLTLAGSTLRSGAHIPRADECAETIPDAQAFVNRLSGGQP
jgi:hypothetical protein